MQPLKAFVHVCYEDPGWEQLMSMNPERKVTECYCEEYGYITARLELIWNTCQQRIATTLNKK